MPYQNPSEILIEASRRRKAFGGYPSDQTVEAHLGHLIDYRAESYPGKWILPGWLTWEATYRVETVRVPRPKTGRAIVDLRCHTCGEAVTLRVRSQRAIRNYYLALAAVVAAAALLCYAVCGEAHITCYTALATLYLISLPELLGQTDHHSITKIIKQAGGGHQLLEPEHA